MLFCAQWTVFSFQSNRIIHNCWYLEMGFIKKKLLDLRTTFIFTLACLLSMTTAGIWEQSIIISFGYISYIWSISNLLCYMINATVIVISRCASSSSNYVLEILGRLWYHKVLNVFVTIGKSVIFFSKKKEKYTYLQ